MKRALVVLSLLFCGLSALAQDQSGSQVINININVSKTVQAVNYQISQSTKLDFAGTPLLPFAKGEANVKNNKGVIEIEVSLQKMSPATQFGAEFLTYVLWAITPEGRSANLGEIQLKGDKSKLNVTSRLPNFAMIVTAEPYFAVSAPSELVVLQAVPNGETKGATTSVVANLLKRSTYDNSKLTAFSIDPKVPLIVYEARNALRIAQLQGAPKYAANAWATAQQTSSQMEDYLTRKQKDPVLTAGRNATQQAEDARSIAVRTAAEEKVAAEKRAAAEKLAEQEREAAAKLAEQQREAAAREAQLKAQQEAEAASRVKAVALAEQEAKERAVAQAAQQKAEQEAQAAALRAKQAEEAQQALRAQLLAQLNAVLQTKDTPNGLVVTMADILFATGKYELSQDAFLKLAKLSGVILAHPGLTLRIEGYTDTTGTLDFNLKLSGQRADAVRTFLVQQGLNPGEITSVGMGQADPVADNSTASGRQQNRRVEIIVSGEAIGTKLTT